MNPYILEATVRWLRNSATVLHPNSASSKSGKRRRATLIIFVIKYGEAAGKVKAKESTLWAKDHLYQGKGQGIYSSLG